MALKLEWSAIFYPKKNMDFKRYSTMLMTRQEEFYLKKTFYRKRFQKVFNWNRLR